MVNFLSRSARFLRRKKRAERYYCDYAAATPLLPEVVDKMQAIQQKVHGNASSIHQEGVAAKAEIEEARQIIARTLQVQTGEVFFTASGTEANNLAIIGYIEQLAATGRSYQDMHVVTTAIEHPSVVNTLNILRKKGVVVQEVVVDEHGLVSVAALNEVLNDATVLLTLAYANSEVGTVQPVSRLIRALKKRCPNAVAHIDAAQAPLWLPCQLHTIGADMLSLDAGKCNGPKGVGVLIKRHTVSLVPVVYGGGQETGLRAGTENTAGIAGAALAIQAAQDTYKARRERAATLSRPLVDELKTAVPQAVFNGPTFTEDTTALKRLPNNVHISLPGFDDEYAVVYLDTHGIAASSKSACAGAGGGESSVVATLTHDTARANSTIRFSLDPELPSDAPAYIARTLADYVALQERVD